MYYRAEQTREVIRKAFFELLKDRPVRDITVSGICEKAGLNRATFYKHYRSAEDIIRELEKQQLDQFRSLMETGDIFSETFIGRVLDLINENKQINDIARERFFSDAFISEMAAIAKEYAFADWRKKMPKATDREVELALTVSIYATLQVVAKEAGKYDRAAVVRYIGNMINGTVKMYE